MEQMGFERRQNEELTYWYRPPRKGAGAPAASSGGERDAAGEAAPGRGASAGAASGASAAGSAGSAGSAAAAATASDAIVFIHGVGVGPAPYAKFLGALAAADESTPMVAFELGAVAQRAFPRTPPSPDRFAELADGALAREGIGRATIMGHSLGSAFARYWAARDEGGRVGGLVLIDPICCMLHHPDTSRSFVYTPLDTAKERLENFFVKKELFTSHVIARHLPWFEAELWLDDCSPRTPTLVAVSEDDAIVPTHKVRQVFGSWSARIQYGVRVMTMPRMTHGAWLADEAAMASLVASSLELHNEAGRNGKLDALRAGVVESAAAALPQSMSLGSVKRRFDESGFWMRGE